MRFLTLEDGELGAVVGGAVVAVGAALDAAGRGDRVPRRMEHLLGASPEELHRLWDRVLDAAAAGRVAGELDEEAGAVRGPRGTLGVAPPIRPVRNLICIGKNYREHVNEVRGTALGGLPEAPIVFTKATTAVIGPGEPIPVHAGLTSELDYEAEVALVIGRGGRAIPPERAWEHVFGYTIVNDVTARDLQRRHRQFFLGKSLDGSAPMGPVVVPRAAMPEPAAIEIRCRVNGELRQQGRLDQLIFDVPTLIATLSAGMTLLPGDIVATGTPSGVGAGLDPPRFLRPGDLIEIEVTGCGRLVNPVA